MPRDGDCKRRKAEFAKMLSVNSRGLKKNFANPSNQRIADGAKVLKAYLLRCQQKIKSDDVSIHEIEEWRRHIENAAIALVAASQFKKPRYNPLTETKPAMADAKYSRLVLTGLLKRGMTKPRAAQILVSTKTMIAEVLAERSSFSDKQLAIIEKSVGTTAGKLAMDAGEIDDPGLLELINGWAEFAALGKEMPGPKKARPLKSRVG